MAMRRTTLAHGSRRTAADSSVEAASASAGHSVHRIDLDHRLVGGLFRSQLLGDQRAERAVRGVELGSIAHGRHYPGGPTVQRVVGEGHRAPMGLDRPHVVKIEVLVVPLHHDFQQRLVLGKPTKEALGEEFHDLLGDGGHGVDAGGVVPCFRVGRQGGYLVTHPG